MSKLIDVVRERRLARRITGIPRPGHLGLLLDIPPPPNRVPASITDVLAWCHECDIQVLTLWVRPAARSEQRVAGLVEEAAQELRRPDAPWTPRFIDPAGRLPRLGNGWRSGGRPATIAICYDGHDEVTQAVRAALASHAKAGRTLAEAAESLNLDDIGGNVYTSGYPDPDLIIRTSGQHRLDSFLMWQAARSEFWFHRRGRSTFRKVDFLTAICDYGVRSRRYGA
jgi:short-chain Z-isoprenyl diphosphate synthase